MFVKKSSLKERMVFVVIKIITQELEIESNLKQRLEIANKKSLQLNNDSNEIKQLMNNLKTTFTNKDKYV